MSHILVSYHVVQNLTINFTSFHGCCWLMSMYAFECPSRPDISSPHVRIQRNLIHVGFFSCNAWFNQPKVPVWKDHIVVNPNYSASGGGEELLHLAPKHLFLCPSLSICACISEMCLEDKVYLSIEHRLSEYFGLGLRTVTCFAPFQGTQQVFKEEEEEDEEAVEGQYYIQIYLLRPSLAIVIT